MGILAGIAIQTAKQLAAVGALSAKAGMEGAKHRKDQKWVDKSDDRCLISTPLGKSTDCKFIIENNKNSAVYEIKPDGIGVRNTINVYSYWFGKSIGSVEKNISWKKQYALLLGDSVFLYASCINHQWKVQQFDWEIESLGINKRVIYKNSKKIATIVIGTFSHRIEILDRNLEKEIILIYAMLCMQLTNERNYYKHHHS